MLLFSAIIATALGLFASERLERPAAITYPAFLEQVEQGKVRTVILKDAAELTVILADGTKAIMPNPRDETLKSTLLKSGVAVEEDAIGQLGTVLGAGMLVLLMFVLMRSRTKGATGLAKYAAIEESREVPSVTFQNVAANEEALRSMRDLVDFIKKPDFFAKYGARIPRGVLLYGPPGTGKTLMARALAGEAGVPFFAVSGADFVQVYVGVGASRIRTLFQKARKAGRGVIFIDEIDAIGKKRDNGNDEREQTLNALLTEMSGFSDKEGIVVLAATNRPDTLDEALLRAGRFDRQIEVPLPGLSERLQILKVHAKDKPMAQDVSFQDIAAQTAMFSGARLESVLNEAAIHAARRQAEAICKEDIDYAFHAALVGEEKNNKDTLEKERKITAVHEAGHALATLLLLPDNKLNRVSIIPSTKGAAGYSMSIAPEKMFHTRQDLLNHMAVALAGRAAEEMAFGPNDVTTGAANDLQKAADIAGRMASEWGMGPDAGKPFEMLLAGKDQRQSGALNLMEQAYKLAVEVLETNRKAWTAMWEKLLQKEALTGEEAAACLEI